MNKESSHLCLPIQQSVPVPGARTTVDHEADESVPIWSIPCSIFFQALLLTLAAGMELNK